MGFGVKENYLISVTNSLIMVKVNIRFYLAGTSLDEVLQMQWPVQQVVPDLFWRSRRFMTMWCILYSLHKGCITVKRFYFYKLYFYTQARVLQLIVQIDFVTTFLM